MVRRMLSNYAFRDPLPPTISGSWLLAALSEEDMQLIGSWGKKNEV